MSISRVPRTPPKPCFDGYSGPVSGRIAHFAISDPLAFKENVPLDHCPAGRGTEWSYQWGSWGIPSINHGQLLGRTHMGNKKTKLVCSVELIL